MNERLRELRIACRPFVTRALRGPRRRRLALGTGLLGLVVVLMGLWIGHSPGPSAHDLRVSLGMEQYRWHRQQTEFCLFVDSPLERDRMLGPAGTETRSTSMDPARLRHAQEAWVLLDRLADPHMLPPEPYRPLQARARALRDARMDLAPADVDAQRRYLQFDWNRARDRHRLRSILDAELVPAVVLYRSPLSFEDTMRLVGMLAAGLLLLLLTVAAPLWVGVRLAQELHDNTLQPLTGTALTARQLVIGLVVGPLAPIAIAAAPLALLILLTGAGAGRLVPTLGLLAMTLAMAAVLVGLAMLAALAVGHRRSPGIVGIGLLALLGLAALSGVGAGVELDDKTLGLVTIVPGAGPVHLLAEAFAPVAHFDAVQARALDLRLLLATAGAVVLAGLALRAVERRIGGTHRQGALRPMEAGLAALTLSVLALLVPPPEVGFGVPLFVGLALVLVPLQIVLVGRIPGGDVPPCMRQLPVARLLGEYSAWLAITVAITVAIVGLPQSIHAGVLVGLVHLAWALSVTALITLRGAALPTTILTKLWLMVGLGVALLEYVTAAVWCMESPDGTLVLPLFKLSPLLGLLQVAMLVWIPLSLVRGLSSAERST